MEITLKRNNAVAKLIKEGVAAQQSALDTIRNAALEFCGGVLKAGKFTSADVPAIISKGRDIYRNDFDGNNNLSSWFGDMATLQLAGDLPISFEDVKTVKGEKVKEEIQTTGADAVQMSKHKVRAAAKAAREELGQARAAGGGRKGPDARSGKSEQVFSLQDFKGLLHGLFANSKGAVPTLNKCLEEYKMVAISAADFEAFQAWQTEHTKKAE